MYFWLKIIDWVGEQMRLICKIFFSNLQVNETTYTHRVDGQFVPHTNMHLKYKIDVSFINPLG